MIQADIHPDRSLAFATSRKVVGLDGEGDMPGMRATRYRGRLDIAGEAQRFAHAHPTQEGDANAATVDRNQITVDFEAVALAFALAAGALTLGPLRLPERDWNQFL